MPLSTEQAIQTSTVTAWSLLGTREPASSTLGLGLVVVAPLLRPRLSWRKRRSAIRVQGWSWDGLMCSERVLGDTETEIVKCAATTQPATQQWTGSLPGTPLHSDNPNFS